MGDDLLGYRFPPNLEEPASLTVNGERLWTATYRTNAHGWRVTPDAPRERQPERYLLFFGGSYTFGHGVEDAETLPAECATRMPEHRVYNFGGIGYGPQQMLALAESGELGAQLGESGGDAIFVFVYDHAARALGTMRTVLRWTPHFPYYALDAHGEATRVGNFDTERPGLHRIYNLLNKSGTVRYMRLDFPLRYSDADYALITAMLTRSRDLLAEAHGLERFHVLLYPVKTKGRAIVDQFQQALEGSGLNVLDYRDLFDPDDPRYFIHEHDTHPAPGGLRPAR